MDIGNRVQKIRKASNITAKELSQLVEVSPSFISAVENNDSKLSIATLNRICDALGVTMAAFFKEEGNVVEAKLHFAISTLPEEKKWQLLSFLEGLFPGKEI